MSDKELTIRVYNVGVGDCIHITVPHPKKAGREDACHILIDCGNVYEDKALTSAAIQDLKNQLPQTASGKRRLDLLVISHAHKDHYSGFAPGSAGDPWYSDVEVGRLWLSTLYDGGNPHARKAQKVGLIVEEGLTAMLEFGSDNASGLRSSPALLAAVKQALEEEKQRSLILGALKTQAGKKNTCYLHDSSPEKTLRLFPGESGGPHFRVLSPAKEIDRIYLNEKGLLGACDEQGGFRLRAGEGSSLSPKTLDGLNVSQRDFRTLYNSMVNNALALALDAGSFYNITGLVLLLEWEGRRFLFPGDIEYTNPAAHLAQQGAWNVILDRHLKGGKKLYVDFLKVGHHGSDNATPWSEKNGQKKINVVLDAIVQDPGMVGGTEKKVPCTIVVSTERIKNYNRTIPYSPMMQELGRRAANHQRYDEFEGYYRARLLADPAKKRWKKDYLKMFKENSVHNDILQPQRTDLYMQEPGCPAEAKYKDDNGVLHARYIDFSFSPA